MKLSDRIKEARESLGENKAVFGKRLGLSRAAVHQWENGDTVPTAANMLLISRITNRRLEWLIEGEKPIIISKMYDKQCMELAREIMGLSDQSRGEIRAFINIKQLGPFNPKNFIEAVSYLGMWMTEKGYDKNNDPDEFKVFALHCWEKSQKEKLSDDDLNVIYLDHYKAA